MTQVTRTDDRLAGLERAMRELDLQLVATQYDVQATEASVLMLALRMNAMERSIGEGGGSQLDPVFERLNAGVRDVRERISALRNAGADSWESLRTGVQDAIDDLRRGVDEATAKSESSH